MSSISNTYDAVRASVLLIEKLQKSSEQIQELYSSSGIAEACSNMASLATYISEQQALLTRSMMNSQVVQSSLKLSNMIAAYADAFDKAFPDIYKTLKPYLEQWENIIKYTSNFEYLYKGIESSLTDVSWDEVETLTVDERHEVINAVKDIASSPVNWQHKLVAYVKEWNERNPVLNWVLLHIVLPIIVGLAIFLGSGCLVRDNPTSTAVVIEQVSCFQIMNVVGQAPYYYKVRFRDDDDEIHCGWVSKRKLNQMSKSLEAMNREDHK